MRGRGRRRVATVGLVAALSFGASACAGTSGPLAGQATTTATATTPTSTSTPTPASTTTAATSHPPTTAAATTTLTPTTTVSEGSLGDVDRLVVAPPDPTIPPYRRAEFGSDWDYDPATGCNTRERVLIDESLVPATVDDRCHPSRGRWRSAYDGVVTTDPADLQIDHRVALADAWRAGAWRWSTERRRAYANDLTDPNTLVAVTASSNESKSDSTPDAWLPPDPADRCPYALAWVEVKVRWSLSVTPAEKAALVGVLSGCPGPGAAPATATRR